MDRSLTFAERIKVLILKSSRLKYRLTRVVLRQARFVVTWSEWAKESAVQEYGIAPGKVVCFHQALIQLDLPRLKKSKAG